MIDSRQWRSVIRASRREYSNPNLLRVIVGPRTDLC